MIEIPPKQGPLKDAVIRICPKCGVVNPAGPSETCPHLQLARFDGVDENFAALLAEVATARASFEELLKALKTRVRQAVHDRTAQIETPRGPMRHSEPQSAPAPQRKVSPLTLESPQAPAPPTAAPAQRRPLRGKRPPASTADPRQLELLVHQPPKGHA